ncbi:MAG: flavin reductase family protein [Solirubrobacteraceae bacterium]
MTTVDETFARITGALGDYPMLIATTVAEGEPAGCLVGFSTQCSIDPPRYLVCLSDKNHTTRTAAAAPVIAVHFVPEAARDLAELFGSQTGDESDKFARCAWHPGPEGLPLLDRCPRWFAGRILHRRRLGDHIGYVLAPFAAADEGGDGGMLMFRQAKGIAPGHEA